MPKTDENVNDGFSMLPRATICHSLNCSVSRGDERNRFSR